jgi:hypothetical protein
LGETSETLLTEASGEAAKTEQDDTCGRLAAHAGCPENRSTLKGVPYNLLIVKEVYSHESDHQADDIPCTKMERACKSILQ